MDASHRNRTGGNILTVILWWVLLTLAFLDQIDALHLWWLFPLALLAPVLILLPLGRR